MPDPEETEREALADLIEAASTEWEADFKAEGIRIGPQADFIANRLRARGFRRLSESERTVTEKYHDEVVGVAQRTIHELEGEVERLRLSESEIRRDQAEKDAVIAQRRIDLGYAGHPIITAEFPDNGQQIAAAIRAQFTPSPETEKESK